MHNRETTSFQTFILPLIELCEVIGEKQQIHLKKFNPFNSFFIILIYLYTSIILYFLNTFENEMRLSNLSFFQAPCMMVSNSNGSWSINALIQK